MAKNSIRDFDGTAANNTDIQSVDISEGCAASGINNALREIMADLKDVSTGTVNLETPAADRLDVDNIRIDGNTISSIDTNGNIELSPNGSGLVGIGTTSPATTAHIQTASGNPELRVESTGANYATMSVKNSSRHYSTQIRTDQSNAYVIRDETGGANRFLIDTNGNAGIGTSSPSNFGGTTLQTNHASTYSANLVSSGAYILQMLASETHGAMSIGARSNHHVAFTTNDTERMRINSSGQVLIGDATPNAAGSLLELQTAQNTANVLYMLKNNQVEMTMGFKSSTDTNFYIGTGSSTIGTNGVFLSNTGSSFSSVSDERKKTVIEQIENASAKVSTLRTVIGRFNHDEDEKRRPFLIAQDVQAVLPEAVSELPDEDSTLGLSYTDVIPLLTAALKESIAKIETLETQRADLEARLTALENA